MNNVLRLHSLSMRFDASIAQWGGAVFGLVLRVFVAWQFLKSGLIKVQDWEATLSLFREEYSVPVLPPGLAAYMGAGSELILPIFLILGLFSRPAALGLFLVNLMAAISYPQLWMFECPAAVNDHIYWGILLLGLLTYGAGQFSLDVWLQRRYSVK